ncbi:MAG: hypothetical protein KIT44_09375 [Opitutaceae bacterium]|nr:hypothetical protein [Opitutaceae bacterium]
MPDLELNIRTKADTSGAKDAAGSLRDVQAAAKGAASGAGQVATGASNASKELGQLSSAGAAGSQVLSGLERASQGGVQGILGVTQAMRGFVALVRGAVAATGPIGLLITGIGLAAGAFALLRRRTNEQVEDQKKAADAFIKTAETATKLNQVRLDSLRAEVSSTVDESKRLLSVLERTLALQNELGSARADAEIAAIEADPTLTQEQRIRRTAEVRERETTQRRAREDALRSQRVGTARESFITQSQAAGERRQEADAQAARVSAIENERTQRQQRLQEIEREIANVGSRTGLSPNARGQLLERLQAERQQLTERGGVSDTEEGAKRLQEQRAIAADLEKAAVAAEEAAERARIAFEDLFANARVEENYSGQIRAAQDQRTRTETTAAIRTAAGGSPEEIRLRAKRDEYAADLTRIDPLGFQGRNTQAALDDVERQLERLNASVVDTSKRMSRDIQKTNERLRADKERNGGG